jgi:hypothetical protein
VRSGVMNILPWPRITDFCARRRRARILLVFGSPLGNAFGDTIIATQHLAFLTSIPNAELYVWTTSAEIWHAISPSAIQCELALTATQIQSEFDLIVLDWVRLGSDFRRLLGSSPAITIFWEGRPADLQIKMPGEAWTNFSLPPMSNHPDRIPQMYRALGCNVEFKQSEVTRPSRNHIYFNPFASTAKKSLPIPFAARLLDQLGQIPGIQILVAPIPPTEIDAGEFKKRHSFLRSTASSRSVQFLDSLSPSEYLDAIRLARLVVTPDTSSQHIAGLAKVPTLIFYNQTACFNHFYWGWPLANHISFCVPLQQFEGLVDLAAVIATHFADGKSTGAVNPFMSALEEFVGLTIEAALSTSPSRDKFEVLDRVHSRASALVKPGWREHLMLEVNQIAKELCQRTGQSLDPAVVRTRLEQLSALKVARLFDCSGNTSPAVLDGLLST